MISPISQKANEVYEEEVEDDELIEFIEEVVPVQKIIPNAKENSSFKKDLVKNNTTNQSWKKKKSVSIFEPDNHYSSTVSSSESVEKYSFNSLSNSISQSQPDLLISKQEFSSGI